MNRAATLARRLWLLLLLLSAPELRALGQPPAPLTLGEVLAAVTNQYPPLLAALIERDVAAGRLRSARGAFDFQLFAKLFGTPEGYYESTTAETGFEQFTGLWGSTIYGGYRLSRGDLLPDYDKDRTQDDGEARLGLRLPLLRDGRIDRRRAALFKARLDREAAEPAIQRQQLDFIRAATVAYHQWWAAGLRWRLAEENLRLAQARDQALTNQVQAGLIPRLVLTDNARLVVARTLGVTQARRRFEGAAIALSLFLRDENAEPLLVGRERLPGAAPAPEPVALELSVAEFDQALLKRPEIRRLRLAQEKARVDLRLARNQRLPALDAGAQVSDNFGAQPYRDLDRTEVKLGLELKVPLQQREARGRIAEIEAQLAQLENQERFAGERIVAEIRDARSALVAAGEQTGQAAHNVFLARELQLAEEERFRQGAADLLALQIREQAAYDAQLLEVDSLLEYFRAAADLAAARADFLAPVRPE